jgi:hypothetical protein
MIGPEWILGSKRSYWSLKMNCRAKIKAIFNSKYICTIQSLLEICYVRIIFKNKNHKNKMVLPGAGGGAGGRNDPSIVCTYE